jgi:hypothetical protein
VDDRPHNPDEFMENNAAFDLNREIRRWRAGLAEAPGLRAEDFDEMECHLQDSVRELQTCGLSPEEAFTIAMRRVGSAASLTAEFGKLNSSAIWIDRMLWMLIGWVSVSIVQSMMVSVAVAMTVPRRFPPFVDAILWVSPLIVAAFVLRSLWRSDGHARRVMTKLLFKPLQLSLAFFALGVIPVLLRFLTLSYVTGRAMQNTLATAGLLQIVSGIIPAVLIFILARIRHQPSQQTL